MKPRIYLDMDGVLADFDKALLDRGIVNEVHFLHKPQKDWTPEEKALDLKVVECMNEEGWFGNLPVMKDAEKLWDMCILWTMGNGPHVLTARPKDQRIADRVKKEKFDWINRNFALRTPHHFNCCVRSQKQDYAVSSTPEGGDIPNILVDDLPANVAEWASAGGIGILHTSVEKTLLELEKIIVNS